MSSIKNLERLQQLHSLIKMERTGTPRELAARLRIGERSAYLLIERLKDFDAVIGYDRGRKTYYYKNDFELEISLSVCIVNDGQVTEIYDGSYFIRNSR